MSVHSGEKPKKFADVTVHSQRNGTDMSVHSGEMQQKWHRCDSTQCCHSEHSGEKPQEWWDADVTDAAAAGMQPQSEPR